MRLVHEVSLIWAFVCPMSLLTAEIVSVIALVLQAGDGQVLEALDEGIDLSAGEG